MKRCIVVLVAFILMTMMFLPDARADYIGFTGNPSGDNWKEVGLSTALGTYIRGSGNWGFDVYTASFTLDAGSPLVGANWKAGDLILGLGGIMSPNTQDFSPRFIAKFGAADATFSPSTTPPTNGNGSGSFSGGAAGIGGVQVDFFYARNWPSGVLPAGLDGTIQTPNHVLWNKDQNLNTDYGKVLALFDTNNANRDILQSFEVLLDLSAVSDPNRGNKGDLVPILFGKGDMAVQQSSDVYTDAFVSNVGMNVPLPGAVWLLSPGLLGIAAMRRRLKAR